MRKFFKDQKALLGVICLAILGMDNTLAISAPDSRTSGPSNINPILAATQVSAASARANFFGDAGGLVVSAAVSPEPRRGFASSVGVSHRDRFIKSGLEEYGIQSPIRYGLSANTDGQFIFSGMGIDRPDGLNVTGYDGKAHDSVDSVPNVEPFQPAQGASEIHAEKAGSEAVAEVSPVPLPAAVWSFLVGLLGILGLKKRKQASTDTAP